MKRNYNTRTTLENFEELLRSTHWQIYELSDALVRGVGHYGNHAVALFPSSRLAQKRFHLPICGRTH